MHATNSHSVVLVQILVRNCNHQLLIYCTRLNAHYTLYPLLSLSLMSHPLYFHQTSRKKSAQFKTPPKLSLSLFLMKCNFAAVENNVETSVEIMNHKDLFTIQSWKEQSMFRTWSMLYLKCSSILTNCRLVHAIQ